MNSAQKTQCKEKMHQRRLNDRRRDQDVNRTLLPLPENLLLFADYISNDASNLFPAYQPSHLPILEMLCCEMCEKKNPSPPLSSPPNTLFFHCLHHPRDISRLTIRRFYDEFLDGMITEHASVYKFVACYHRCANLKEHLSRSACKDPSEEEKVSNYFRRFAAEKDDDMS